MFLTSLLYTWAETGLKELPHPHHTARGRAGLLTAGCPGAPHQTHRPSAYPAIFFSSLLQRYLYTKLRRILAKSLGLVKRETAPEANAQVL